jgi:hypothetical protein
MTCARMCATATQTLNPTMGGVHVARSARRETDRWELVGSGWKISREQAGVDRQAAVQGEKAIAHLLSLPLVDEHPPKEVQHACVHPASRCACQSAAQRSTAQHWRIC